MSSALDVPTAAADVRGALERLANEGTPAERRLSLFFLASFDELPFETAASIADKVGLSQMTVGRFLRRLGFQGLDALKAELRGGAISSAWQITDRIETLRHDLQEGRLLADLVAEQVEVLHRLYELSNRPEWARAVTAIISAPEVFVASYQNIGGIARYFSEQLTYARDNVRYMDGLNGTYAELLEHAQPGALLVLIDARRFASKSRLLARQALEAGRDVLVVTDPYCDWIEPGRHLSLVLPATRPRTWDSFMSLAAMLDFLVTSVVIAGGEESRRRTERISALQDLFGDFDRR